jgi:NTE family protein
MSIPFFFEPATLPLGGSGALCYIVDGGVLSNFPVHLFDDGTPDPPWPTFGYMLAETSDILGSDVSHQVSGPFSLLASLFLTMMEAHDRIYISNGAFARTIMIPTLGVKTTDFDIAPQRAEALYRSGLEAGREFFRSWDFEQYKAVFRQAAGKSRREMLLEAASSVRQQSPARSA